MSLEPVNTPQPFLSDGQVSAAVAVSLHAHAVPTLEGRSFPHD